MAATSTTSLLLFLLTLLLLQSPASITAEPPSLTNAATPDTSVSPPLAAVMIVLVGAFFLSGLVFVAIRHIIDSGCCRFLTGGRAVGGGGGARRQAVAEGLRPEAVQAIPTYFYKDVKMHRLVVKGELECAVCLNEFQDLEALRLMPECSHVFHPECVDPWLMSQATCPVCRTVIKPTSNNLGLDEHVITIDHDLPLGPESMEIPKPHSTNGEDDRITLRLPKEIRGYRARITWCGQAQATHESSESELAPPLSGSSGAAHVEVA